MKRPVTEKERRRLELTGIVQGVGFRPFVYRLAKEHELKGFVRNDGRGVTIDIEGDAREIGAFVGELAAKLPPHALVERVTTTSLEPAGYEEFRIDESGQEDGKTSLVSPDIATCDDCLSEILSQGDRRYHYPFTNCTNCGPRFTIVRDIPYDRANTTMSDFAMCPTCAREYDDPGNRRFHAQPNACPVCGPQVSLERTKGESMQGDEALHRAVELLKDGRIVAVKGLGGFHLACDARRSKAVTALRKRKFREDKPFALMARDIETVKRHCYVDRFEEELLQSPRRPIVLLRKRDDSDIAFDVAPRQKYLGFMLPYTPLHHLLLEESGLVLVMTSGNLSDEPISYENEEAKERLGGVADSFLVHNRKIETRCDDSVTREFKSAEYMVRRARGYSPHPIALPFEIKKQILSCGAEVKNTFCLGRDRYAFLGHHIGDLENVETYESFTKGIEHYSRLFSVNPEVVAHDLHPDYLSTKYALNLEGVARVGVQHHHAHICSVMAENGLDGDVIGVALDGTGYGEDGNIWGCEFFVLEYSGYERLAHLDYVPMPGSSAAIEEPYRMAVSYLYRAFGEDMFELRLDLFKRHDEKRVRTLVDMIKKGFNSPLASSTGRLFDAVSSILSVMDFINFEGQAAIELEMVAVEGYRDSYPYDVRGEGAGWIIDVVPMIKAIVEESLRGVSVGQISAKFHHTVAVIVLDLCARLRTSSALSRVALSGGVFQNMLLLADVHSLLTKEGFEVFVHHKVPTNDGCISLGQLAVANHRL